MVRKIRRPGPKSRGNGENGAKDRRKSRRVSLLTNEEGVLYTVKVADRPLATRKHGLFRRNKGAPNIQGKDGSNDDAPPPQSDTQQRAPQQQQYTISKIDEQKYRGAHVWFVRFFHSFGIDLSGQEDVDSYRYKPSKSLFGYITWTFYASFSAVFISFLILFVVLCLLYAGLFALSGEFHPECIVVSGEPYGTNPATKFGDAFALSWTTFTTVGYGNVYAATGNDYETLLTRQCSAVVFLCTLESFMGLIYAGMCAAILFGKVNRVQSHAHLTFANTVCLQYEEVDSCQYVDDDLSDSDIEPSSVDEVILKELEGKDQADEKDDRTVKFTDSTESPRQKNRGSQIERMISFREQYKGCPILKFQVVNDFCNKPGGEIIDGIMKVIGIKTKRLDGEITHSQYVRVNLLDFEHPFFGRVWHGVHILDETSPLLTNTAKQKIGEHGGKWPDKWLKTPENIRRKLEFESLVVTVAGVSNVSASTVHAYKRYKFQDVIIGFDFAPLVYENEHTGRLEVNLALTNDVREQHNGGGEDLSTAQSPTGNESTRSSFRRGSSFLFQKSVLTQDN
mmetsp:Transcript_35434/g.60199  ORF Transcript_35434/g.60199 Transcript_35434/m.60199 type:complete len:565 (-) Transcript_35434:225-1919(-)